MPTTKSAKKRHRQSLERRATNRATKSSIKTQIRKVREAIAAGDLAKAFGAEFSNGYARPGHRQPGVTGDTFDRETGLAECAVTRGRADGEGSGAA